MKKFYDYVINHKNKYEIYTNEVIFKNEFETIDFYIDNIQTINKEFHINLLRIFHISEMIIKTIFDIRTIT